jgi:hypothetical protein
VISVINGCRFILEGGIEVSSQEWGEEARRRVHFYEGERHGGQMEGLAGDARPTGGGGDDFVTVGTRKKKGVWALSGPKGHWAGLRWLGRKAISIGLQL